MKTRSDQGTQSLWALISRLSFSIDYVQVGEWRTRVLRAGAGRPLVLIHGSGGHLEAYMRNFEYLSRSFHVVAYDCPGHGYTTLASEDLELPTYVDHLAHLLDALGIAGVSISGESLGGWLALKFAAAYPDRVQRLVLNTPGGTMQNPSVMARIRDLSLAAVTEPTTARVRDRLEWLMADPSRVTEELVAIRQAIYEQPGFVESMRRILCLQDPVIRARNLLTDADLAAVVAPTLVLWTSDDPSGPASAGRELTNRLKAGENAFISDAGHWPQWEQPDQFHEVLTGFLQ